MVVAPCRCHGAGMQTTEQSVRLIETAQTVELMAFSPDGDPLAMVPIAKSEAQALIAMPVTMGHGFWASVVNGGRVFVEAIDANGHALAQFLPTPSHAFPRRRQYFLASSCMGNRQKTQ